MGGGAFSEGAGALGAPWPRGPLASQGVSPFLYGLLLGGPYPVYGFVQPGGGVLPLVALVPE